MVPPRSSDLDRTDRESAHAVGKPPLHRTSLRAVAILGVVLSAAARPSLEAEGLGCLLVAGGRFAIVENQLRCMEPGLERKPVDLAHVVTEPLIERCV